MNFENHMGLYTAHALVKMVILSHSFIFMYSEMFLSAKSLLNVSWMIGTLKKIIQFFFKVSGCKQFILATFFFFFLKVSQLNLFI